MWQYSPTRYAGWPRGDTRVAATSTLRQWIQSQRSFTAAAGASDPVSIFDSSRCTGNFSFTSRLPSQSWHDPSERELRITYDQNGKVFTRKLCMVVPELVRCLAGLECTLQTGSGIPADPTHTADLFFQKNMRHYDFAQLTPSLLSFSQTSTALPDPSPSLPIRIPSMRPSAFLTFAILLASSVLAG